MPSMVIIPGNDFEPIEDSPNVPFVGAQIIHVQLRIMRFYKKQLRFKVKAVLGAVGMNIQAHEAAAYAQDVADGKVPSLLKGWKTARTPPPKTPYDVPVTAQCWMVMELDRQVANWQFNQGFLAATLKNRKHVGDNFWLRHVYAQGHPKYPKGGAHKGDIQADDCRVMFFGVVRRAPQESQHLNLHTEFRQKAPNASPDHKMVVIFDPDIPNGGGFTIP